MVKCQSGSESETTEVAEVPQWLNHIDTVGYVGMETCQSCHYGVAHTFQHTGMGQSFDRATPTKAAYAWDGSKVVHDPHLNLSYRPYFVDTILMVEEFRVVNGDTVHSRTQKVDYIVGSGQHTNSHMWTINGHVFQAPFTYYTQRGVADLPPGFEDGANSRFDRKIGLECMSCHNAMPTQFALGSDNVFDALPRGIDCERCHGPGELHVAQKKAGIIVDTSVGPDYTIVNPSKLPLDRQVEVCQRCHLQGNAVLVEGKSFFDFIPGMKLSEVMDVYTPRYTDNKESFIMASHVDRLKQSNCFIASEGQLNCTSCHNPHISVKEMGENFFNRKCMSCHTSEAEQLVECTEEMALREKANNDCVSCHMPVSGSSDIPHVTVHDHWIRVNEDQEQSRMDKEARELLALVAVNNANPSDRSKARAFLQQYERFGGEAIMLDSAWHYIRLMPDSSSFTEHVHYFYLRNQFGMLRNYIQRNGLGDALNRLTEKRWDNLHGWTAYRIGEAFNALGMVSEARTFYARSTELSPRIVEFWNKLGTASLKLGDVQTASSSFDRILAEQPYAPEGHGNRAYVDLLSGDTASALSGFKAALELNPDYSPALRNRVSIHLAQGNWSSAAADLRSLRRLEPENQQYRMLLDEVERME